MRTWRSCREISAAVAPRACRRDGSSALLISRLTDLVLHGLPKRIQDDEMAAAAMLVGAKLATAVILAAAVSG